MYHIFNKEIQGFIMYIIRDKNFIIKEKTCIALGNFDGVHNGHRALIEHCIKYSKADKLKSCIYTFNEHTTHFLGNEKKLITTTDERIDIFRALGCDTVVLDDFESVKEMTPEEFCESIIVSRLNAKAVICGENYSFGKGGKGNVSLLTELLSERGIEIIVQPSVDFNGRVLSSTLVREYIMNGNIELANKLISRPYSISGEVIHGKKLGRRLGYPTLNMTVPSCKVMPSYGVYASVTMLDGKLRTGITNIGKRPTVDSDTDSTITCETHLIDYYGDDYGKNVTVFLLKFLRDETRFKNIDELKEGICADCKSARQFLDSYDMTTLEDIK